jgi:molybdate transport system substrate-binding protein
MVLLLGCSLLLCAGCGPRTATHKLAIAAAADLQFALDELVREFRAAHPEVDPQPVFGSSGNFYAQIRSQAPFDIFLSADLEYPRKLVREGIGAEASLFVYGAGRLVVWVPAASGLDPATALHSEAIRRLAIANPLHAPYGRAAEAALRGMGVYDQFAKKLVLGENIAQTLQFVQSGAADAGIVALSLALAPPLQHSQANQGRYWEIPPDQYPKMEQGGVIIIDSPAARSFRAFLLGEAGRSVLKRYGFFLPEK